MPGVDELLSSVSELRLQAWYQAIGALQSRSLARMDRDDVVREPSETVAFRQFLLVSAVLRPQRSTMRTFWLPLGPP